jgi:hypothetical protein
LIDWNHIANPEPSCRVKPFFVANPETLTRSKSRWNLTRKNNRAESSLSRRIYFSQMNPYVCLISFLVWLLTVSVSWALRPQLLLRIPIPQYVCFQISSFIRILFYFELSMWIYLCCLFQTCSLNILFSYKLELHFFMEIILGLINKKAHVW